MISNISLLLVAGSRSTKNMGRGFFDLGWRTLHADLTVNPSSCNSLLITLSGVEG